MSARNSIPQVPVREIGDRFDWEVRYWQDPIDGAAPSSGRWVAIARCPNRQYACIIADGLAESCGWQLEVWQVSGADIPDPDVPPPPGGYRPLNEPKLFDRYPNGSSRFRGRGGDG